MKRLSLGVGAALAGFLTGACTVGPNYRKPNVPVPPNFRNATPEQQQPDASLADLPWWQIFKDPVLENLIRTALERNYEVRIAAEQIIAARALVGIVRADQLPQVSVGPSYSGGKTSINPTNTNALAVIADISYQLDLFGGLRRATESAKASLLATEEARRTVLVTLVSDVGTNYFQLLALDLQLGIARETVVRQEESVALTKSRADGGVATDVDWLQARQVLDAANSRIPELERQIRRTEDALSILLGNYPEDVPRGAVLTAQQLPPELPVGLSSALLDRRPDIRQAEKNLIHFNAEIGVARAQFFPQITLTGSGGRSAVFTSLMNSSTNIWSYGASLFQPVFEGGRLTSNLRYAESRQRQSLTSSTIRERRSPVSGFIHIQGSQPLPTSLRVVSAMKTRTERRACCPPAVSSGCKPAAASGMVAAPASRDGRGASSFGSPCRPNSSWDHRRAFIWRPM